MLPSTLMAVWSSIAYVVTGTPFAHFSTFAMVCSSKMGFGLSTWPHCEINQTKCRFAPECHIAAFGRKLKVPFGIAVKGSHNDAPRTNPDVHQVLERRQSISEAGLAHPVLQIHHVAAPDEQRIGLLESRAQFLLPDARQGREFEQRQ